jgi:hypothetical protein
MKSQTSYATIHSINLLWICTCIDAMNRCFRVNLDLVFISTPIRVGFVGYTNAKHSLSFCYLYKIRSSYGIQ